MVRNTLNDHCDCESIKGKSLCGLRNQPRAANVIAGKINSDPSSD